MDRAAYSTIFAHCEAKVAPRGCLFSFMAFLSFQVRRRVIS